MRQLPSQNPGDPSGQSYQSSSYAQPEQPSTPPPLQQQRYQQQVEPSSSLPPEQTSMPLYQQPDYAPTAPGAPWQQQGYPPQQAYQQSMQTPPGYAPVPGSTWAPQQPAPSAVQMTAVNVNVNARQGANGCVRAIYFVFVGWWLGFWCLEIGFLLCMLIFTLPLGLMILNRLPQIMTLKPSAQAVQTKVNVTSAVGAAGVTNAVSVDVSVTAVQQRPILIRAIYYIFVGWWVGYIWASLAYFMCLTILGLPLGIVMLNYLPVVLTLRRN
ncbi:MAG TPA: hypothetical protein VKV19_19445 [Ktedonobacteraceae bacterium]|nr:hypothetical protein [Ktedonobacteraceae bacterium]